MQRQPVSLFETCWLAIAVLSAHKICWR
jgi:hypothetical protein